jgi:hypothetical protein
MVRQNQARRPTWVLHNIVPPAAAVVGLERVEVVVLGEAEDLAADMDRRKLAEAVAYVRNWEALEDSRLAVVVGSHHWAMEGCHWSLLDTKALFAEEK